MTAAYRLKGLGWFGSCVAVALGFYLVSLQVAAERKKLDQVNDRIASAERDLRALETEFDTRANMVQLERWNGDTLSLAAPTANQFVRDEAQLAALDVHAAAGPDVQTAALVVPSLPPQVTVAPMLAATTPAPVTAPHGGTLGRAVQMAASRVAVAPAVVAAAAIHRVVPAHVVTAPATPVSSERLASATHVKTVTKPRPQAVAMLDGKLLSDSTLGDLLAGARSEASRRR